MACLGYVKDGKVILDDPSGFPEGAKVVIELVDERIDIPPGKGIMRFAGLAKGLPSDASVNLDHYLYGHPKQ